MAIDFVKSNDPVFREKMRRERENESLQREKKGRRTDCHSQ